MSNARTYRYETLRLGLSISIISAAIVAYEIQLMHFFTIVQWHHFAYMVISIALLGFGASGALLSLYRNELLKKADWLLPFFMISSGLLMSISVRVSRMDFLLFDSYLLFVDYSQFGRLLGSYFLFFLPFLMGSLALGLVFVKKVAQIGIFYFSDMLGSGIGGILAIFLLWHLEPVDLPWVIALMPMLAGVMLIKKKGGYLLSAYALLALVICFYQGFSSFELKSSQFKSISYALNLPEAKIETRQSSPYGLVQVVSSPVQRYAPGLSLSYVQEVRPSKVIFNNGNWYAAIPQGNMDDSLHVLNHSTMALPYVLESPKKVLIFQAGAGFEVAHALKKKADQIFAVEPNAIVTRLIKGPYAEYTDSLFYRPEVQVYNTSPRSYLKQSDKEFDLIQLPLSGAFGGSVGLNALHEENLLTSEALLEMWQKLSPKGMIVLSSFIDVPPRIIIKNAALIAGMLENLSIVDPLGHVVAIRSWSTLTYVIKKSALGPKDLLAVNRFCDDYGFDPVLLPGSGSKEIYNTLEDDAVFSLVRKMFGPEREILVKANDFNISIPSDDRPYFYQFLKIRRMARQWQQLGARAAFLELGYLIVLVTLLQVVIMAFVFIILPLFKLGFKGGQKAWVIFYFSGLGLGYMFLEIVLIKYFVRFLGHPIYAVATVISIMLFSSGLGSLYSSKLALKETKLIRLTALITSLILVYALGLGFVLSQTEGWPIWGKILITFVSIGFPAFFMGMPFPMGLQLVDKKQQKQVPWAWGINGCVSVISTSLATVIAVEFGFTAVLLLAALAYFMACISIFSLRFYAPNSTA
ncbi:hypothetical protein [Lutimonas vermicola]|uniref:Spermidine synthase n=1 Tax=Lutimonas vermicola TaxID=414288 RepID=A0ABU9L0X9_9FLAO